MKSNFSDIGDYTSVTYENEEYRGDGFVYGYLVVDPESGTNYSAYNVDLSNDMPVSKLYYQSLLNIIQFCSENNIQLVLVNQPMPTQTLDTLIDYDNYIHFLKQIAEEHDVDYWNFDLYKGDIGLAEDCYMDEHHLNGKGAEIYTKFFCDFVNEVQDGNSDPESYFYDSYQ
jgi:hypothetical protein